MFGLSHLRATVVAGLSLFTLIAAPASAQPDQLHLSLNYGGRLFLKVLEVNVDQTFDPTSFQSKAHLRTSGLLALFHRVDVRAESQGRIEPGGAIPKTFSYDNAGHKNRKVIAVWTGSDVSTHSEPQFGSMGDPAATREQRVEAADPLTILTRLTIAPSDDHPCEGVRRFYDGKQRYDVAFAYKGVAQPDERERRLGLTGLIHCSLTYHEVAGFKRKPPEQRNQGLRRDVSLTLGRLGSEGPWVISQLRADTVLGPAHIDLETASMSGPTAVLAQAAAASESVARR